MQMSTAQPRFGSLLALGALLAVVLAAAASPAKGATAGASAPAVVPTEGETASAPVPTEPAPVSAAVESAAASVAKAVSETSSEAAPTPTPVETTTAAVEEQVTDVAASVTGSETTEQVKAVAKEAMATAPVRSVAGAANMQPAVDKVVGSVRSAVEKTGVAPPVGQLPDSVPALSPDAPLQALPPSPALLRGGASALAIDAELPSPLPGPAPHLGDEAPRTSEHAVPVETRPVVGWIDGLNLRELFAGAVLPGPRAHGTLFAPSAIDSIGATAASHASPPEPTHHSPFNAPGPASGLSTSASPSPGGGSFFVPIAALLALLALAAPAISRRWKGALAAPVPSLFVCALERPG